MKRPVRAVGLAVVGMAVVFAVSGCSQYNNERGKGDAPVLGKHGDDTPAEVYNFPDGFGNLATKCVGHGYRAYVTTNNSAPSNVQLVADPACGGPAPSNTASSGAVTPNANPTR